MQLSLLAFTWLLSSILDARRVRAILRLVAGGGVLAALYGILQYFGWDPWLPSEAYHAGEGEWTIVRPPGTLGHASYFGAYLTQVVFAGAALVTTENKRLWKILGGFACALGSLAVVLSGTRSAALGLAAGSAVLLVWFRPRLSRVLAIVGVLAIGLVGLYFSPAGQKLRSRAHWSLDEPPGGARLWLWRDTMRMAQDCWLGGCGPEMFSAQFPRYQSVELARAYPDFHHESPHNMFLDALISQGVAGLVVLLCLVGVGGYAAWRAKPSNPQLAGVLAASLAATIVCHQFTVFIVPTALFFYLTIAMLTGLESGSDAAESGGQLGVVRFSSLALRIVLAGLLSVFAVRLLVADRALAMAKQHLEAGRLEEAIREHARVQRWQPPGMNAELWYSRSLLRFAETSPRILDRMRALQEAAKAAQRATRFSEEPHHAYYNLAAVSAMQNDFAATEKHLRAAIDAAPRWFKTHWVLAQVLAEAGRLEEAEEEAAVAVRLDGGKYEEVQRTHLEIRSKLLR